MKIRVHKPPLTNEKWRGLKNNFKDSKIFLRENTQFGEH